MPILEHDDLELVPAFMVVHVEHFKPKWLSQPLTASPFSIHVIAVLGKKIHPGDKDFMGQTYMLKETC